MISDVFIYLSIYPSIYLSIYLSYVVYISINIDISYTIYPHEFSLDLLESAVSHRRNSKALFAEQDDYRCPEISQDSRWLRLKQY